MQKIYIQIFLLIFVPLFLISSAFFYYSYKQELEKESTLELSRDLHNIELEGSVIAGELKGLSSDVLYLGELFHDLPPEGNLQYITEELRLFAAHRGIYDQLRYLDYSGMEKIRINYNDGQTLRYPHEID